MRRCLTLLALTGLLIPTGCIERADEQTGSATGTVVIDDSHETCCCEPPPEDKWDEPVETYDNEPVPFAGTGEPTTDSEET